MTDHDNDINSAPLTADDIKAALTQQRERLTREIGAAQDQRAKANAVIAARRAELADVERMLKATAPRRRKGGAA